MRTGLKVILLPGLLAAWLCCTNPAVADTVNAQDLSALDDGLADVPPADLAGWFLTFDPSSEWTSAANIATMESWLVLVEDLYDDPSLLSQLQGLGMNDSSLAIPSLPGETLVPEPATLELLGGPLAILGLCARKRLRRVSDSAYVSLSGFD